MAVVVQAMTEPQSAMLGRRLHLQHGPIDLIIEAWGDDAEVRAAYRQARTAFAPVLQSLVDELPLLRSDARSLIPSSPPKRGSDHPAFSGPVARRMLDAVAAHEVFITPMATVAGSVADHVLSALQHGRRLERAMVNNGGDIALWLGPQQTATVGLGDMRETGVHLRPMTIGTADGIGGIATSGWRGRSHSLGIADFVTVFAASAAAADAAATLIANAVDVPGSSRITRERADALSPDSDLGARLVTTDVARLSECDVQTALASGKAAAEAMCERRTIVGAVLGLQDAVLTVGGTEFTSAITRGSKQLEGAS